MKFIFLSACCLALCCAASAVEIDTDIEAHKSVIAYSGSTYDSQVWSEPYVTIYGSQTSCTAGATKGYVSFVATFETAGVREIIVNSKSLTSYSDVLSVFVYSGGINLARPCIGLLAGPLQDQFLRTGGPIVDDFVYFPAGTYTFVLSGSSSFAINVITPAATGLLSANSSFWSVPSFNYARQCSVSTSTRVAFATYTWTQGTSGLFDITTFFTNPTRANWFYPGVVLYSGAQSAKSLEQQPCNNEVIDYVSSSYFGTSLLSVNLTAGEVYTAALSSRYAGFLANWGIDIVPTRLRTFNQKGFTQPDLYDTDCETGSYTNTGWSAVPFYTSTNGIYLLSVAAAPAPYAPASLYMFLYQGITWDNNNLYAPPTCPTNGSLSYSSHLWLTAMFDSQQLDEYTLVVALSTQATPAQAYQLFALTGPVLGHRPPVSSTGNSYVNSFTSGTFGTTSDACKLSGLALVAVTTMLSFLLS